MEGDSLTITTTTTTTISPFQRIVVESSSGSGGVPTASGGRGLSLDDLKKLLEIAKQSSQSQQPNTGARGASGPSTGRGITISGRSGGGALQQITEGATGGASGLSSLLGALGNMDVVGILAGSAAVSLPPIEEIEEACRKASTNFVNILRQQTADMWCAAAARFSSITEDNFWKGCISRH